MNPLSGYFNNLHVSFWTISLGRSKAVSVLTFWAANREKNLLCLHHFCCFGSTTLKVASHFAHLSSWNVFLLVSGKEFLFCHSCHRSIAQFSDAPFLQLICLCTACRVQDTDVARTKNLQPNTWPDAVLAWNWHQYCSIVMTTSPLGDKMHNLRTGTLGTLLDLECLFR